MTPRIIYEDKNFLAVDKPAGLLTHSTTSSKEETLVDWLKKRYPEVAKIGDDPKTRPGIVHRLDRDTSGIMLIARNQKYFEYLKNLFQTRAIKKTYRALVYGRVIPKKGSIKKEIRIKSGTTKRTVFKGRSERAAVTEYKVLRHSALSLSNGSKEDFSWVELQPLTGRTHQIRVHLASIGHPVVGDKLYTSRKYKAVGQPYIGRQMLHAYSLEFSPAPGKRLKLAANLPADMKVALRAVFE
ncbi:MAG: RluA family pseudouridine synthase [Candidatus Colwellbacteria bacterium]|nr:RluA family pseudouridine synthase [Candidatus Colwellbacteria bacterium]